MTMHVTMHMTTRVTAQHDVRDAGFSLVEVMVAMIVFMIGAMSLLAAFVSSLDTTQDNRSRLVAANLAASEIDAVRQIEYTSITTSSRTQVVGPNTYTVIRSVTPKFSTAGVVACNSSGSNQQQFKKVSVRVEFPHRESVKPVRADTLVASPPFDPTRLYGALGVSVINALSNPLEGVLVSVNATIGRTDETGCAFFDNLTAPANYAVSITGPAGLVAPPAMANISDGLTPKVQTQGVVAGQVNQTVFQVDQAMTVTPVVTVANSTGANLTGYALPTSLKASLLSSTNVVRGAAVAVTSVPSWRVFPDSTGFNARLGACAKVPVNSTPGQVSNPALSLVPVDVTATNSSPLSPTLVSGLTVSATQSGTCAETLSWTATTDTSGRVAVALPPGGPWSLTLKRGATVVGTPTLTTVARVPMIVSVAVS